ncbi:MAG: hypothetical protein ACI846_000093 [Pseudoalteromonas distincta]|jgi:hypothetical protein
MSDNDINTLKRMPLKKIVESTYWTEKLVAFANQNPGLRLSFNWMPKIITGV